MSKLEDILNSGIHFSKKDPYSTSHVPRMYLACTSHLEKRGFKRLNGEVSLAYFRLFCAFMMRSVKGRFFTFNRHGP